MFDLHRSINIQSVIINQDIGDALFDKIEDGRVNELNSEVIESFLSIFPKESDEVALKAAITQLGICDVQSALTYLECGKVEAFMLNLLVNRNNLLDKAHLIHKIQ